MLSPENVVISLIVPYPSPQIYVNHCLYKLLGVFRWDPSIFLFRIRWRGLITEDMQVTKTLPSRGLAPRSVYVYITNWKTMRPTKRKLPSMVYVINVLLGAWNFCWKISLFFIESFCYSGYFEMIQNLFGIECISVIRDTQPPRFSICDINF